MKKRDTQQRHTGARESSLERVTLNMSGDLRLTEPGVILILTASATAFA